VVSDGRQNRKQGSQERQHWLLVERKEDASMTLNAHRDPMTDEQRLEIKRLCEQAGIPDKSGELLTRHGAASIIDDLREKAAEHGHSSR
jgi:hypothetical protein